MKSRNLPPGALKSKGRILALCLFILWNHPLESDTSMPPMDGAKALDSKGDVTSLVATIEAAAALHAVPDEEVRAGLLVRFRGEAEVAQRAFARLAELGEAGLKALAQLLRHPRAQVRQNAAHYLGLIGGPQIVLPLMTVLRDASPGVRDQAVWALGRSASNVALGLLRYSKFRDPSLLVRSHAATWLEMLQQVLEVERLPDPVEQQQRLVALAKYAYVRERLVQRGTEVVPALIAALDHPDLAVAVGAAKVLAQIGDERALEPLFARYQATLEGESVAAFAEALANFRHPAVWPYLLRLLELDNPSAEYQALCGLRRWEHPDREAVILNFLERQVAAGAHLEKVTGNTTTVNPVAEACVLLGELGSMASLPLLERIAAEAPPEENIVHSLARQSWARVRARIGGQE